MHEFEYKSEVRGYELDSFGHVNNAVYLNYMEQARWKIMQELDFLKYFKQTGSFLIVVETNIRYIRELKLFEQIKIKSGIFREGVYLIFKQTIRNEKDEKVAHAKIKTLFVSNDRIPQDIPEKIYSYINE